MSSKPPTYIVGVDLAKKSDYTALVVLKRTVPQFGGYPLYDAIHIDRWRNRDYSAAIPEIERVQDRLRSINTQWMLEHRGYVSGDQDGVTVSTIIDQTGVGEAVIESLRAAGLQCSGIIITGGDKAHKMESGDGWRVPKKELVATVEVLLQNRRLRVAEGLAMAPVLMQELQAFKATIKLSTGNVSYAADETWRENPHDDTVLALAMAAWFGENHDPYAWDEFDRWMVSNAGSLI